jgi:hypothetical protein
MADQIKKIIFTTKEAYDQKAAAGTLDPSVVYAIDASQAITVVEVKEAVDTGFSEFGLNLGLDREAVEFYKIPVGLTDMLKDMVKEKFNVEYNNGTVVRYGNGTKQIDIDIINHNGNSSLKVIQDGTDHGFVKFELRPEITPGYISTSNSVVNRVTIPDGVDITREFELKVSNLFKTTSLTATIKPSFEADMVEMLNSLNTKVDFTQDPTIQTNTGVENSYIIDNAFLYCKDATNFSPRDLNGYNYSYHAIFPDNANVSNIYDTFIVDGNVDDTEKFRLITNIGFTKYVDIPTGTWKDFPESVKTIAAKFGTKYQAVTKMFEDQKTLRDKANDVLKSINFSSVITTTGRDISDSDTTKLTELANAEVIVYDSYGYGEDLNDLLIKANAITPVKAKIVYLWQSSNNLLLDKLHKFPSIKALWNTSVNDHEQFPEGSSNIVLISQNNDISGVIDGKVRYIQNASFDVTVPSFGQLRSSNV